MLFLLLLLLLLLRSPATSLWFTILGEIFAYVTVSNSTIEVVTFHLRGLCMLGVLLLPAFNRLGHEYQDFLSTYDEMYVSTDWTSVYTPIRKNFGRMKSEHMSTPRDKSPLPGKKCSQRNIEPTTLHYAGQRAQHTTNDLFRPPLVSWLQSDWLVRSLVTPGIFLMQVLIVVHIVSM